MSAVIRRNPTRAVTLRIVALGILAAATLALTACQGPELETRTFQVQYLPTYQIDQLIAPYVFTDRETNPGMMSATEGAVTVRETADNLAKIERVLAEYDRPKPMVMLNFQIIEANGDTDTDPAIAAVEAELRRLFRFDGYELLAETQVAAIQGTGIRQAVGGSRPDEGFQINGGVTEVRRGAESTTVTLDVQLWVTGGPPVLETSVTVPTGHSVVLGTANSRLHEGALILVVRAEVAESGVATGP